MKPRAETLVLTAGEVALCLAPSECRDALSRAFAMLAEGLVPAPRAVGFEAGDGGFHAKSAMFVAERPRFVTKVNGNFPRNPERLGLPTIQGVVVLADAADGRPLAVMDSGSLTAIRTAAATAVAAGFLALPGATVAAIVGCGRQGAGHVEALLPLRAWQEIRLVDLDRSRAERLAARYRDRTRAPIRVVNSVSEAARGADVIVTCTPGDAFILGPDDVSAGAFVAAVGADHPRKKEMEPALMARARVVVDDLDQCATCGDLHHAIEAGAMRREDVHADLATVALGNRGGRPDARDIVVFDSTGIALEDVVAADLVYERALARGVGLPVRFGA